MTITLTPGSLIWRGAVAMILIVAQLPLALASSIEADLNAVGSTFAQKNAMESVLITTEDGRDVWRSKSELELNGASTIKLMTALAVLKRLGPDYRFSTQIVYAGTVNPQTGTLHGDLYFRGNDPTLTRAGIQQLTNSLRQAGIQRVEGNIYVEPQFCLNRKSSAAARRSLSAILNPPIQFHRRQRKQQQQQQQQTTTLLPFSGTVKVQSPPTSVTTAVTAAVDSTPLRQILKSMLTSSDNYMAERLGHVVGSAKGLSRIMQHEYGLSKKLRLATTSGLGINRVTASDLEKVIRALVEELARHKLTPDAIMAVGGSEGTLRRRFDDCEGSVIAKTGTLIQTDRGASALAGILRTVNGGTHYFVILHQRGSVGIFKKREDLIVQTFQHLHGGATRFAFLPPDSIGNS